MPASNRANPFALMLSGAMLLRHIGEQDAADRLEAAIADVTREGQTLTYDLAREAEPRDVDGAEGGASDAFRSPNAARLALRLRPSSS